MRFGVSFVKCGIAHLPCRAEARAAIAVRRRRTRVLADACTGWTTNGKMFDSSIVKGQPATFPVDGVIPGWTEGLQLMVEGEKTRFWIPENLAYKGQSAPYGMLVFDVELIKISEGK